ncbi:DoxX family protein [Paraburkholderia graminis]|uniref:DoxX family protein n=1 Tax=Paraburkholderia graminis TaxID=60548 RepID=UPI0027D8656F|nr:DoxX family protein [Paraburkholderia graminis]
MSKFSWRQILPVVLAAFFVVGSLSNIVAPRSVFEEYLKWGYPHWFHFVTGSLELMTAVLLARARTRLWGSAARLHRDVGRAGNRDSARRIRTRGGAASRGDTIDCCRLDCLAQAARCRFCGCGVNLMGPSRA